VSYATRQLVGFAVYLVIVVIAMHSLGAPPWAILATLFILTALVVRVRF
jgi:hypothetical protein